MMAVYSIPGVIRTVESRAVGYGYGIVLVRAEYKYYLYWLVYAELARVMRRR